MKILVTMKCGHEEMKEVFGSTKEREKKIWYFENHCSCAECEKKAREEANAKAAEESIELDLVELSGSEKQVAWANTIRMNMIKELKDYLTNKYDDELINKIVFTYVNSHKSAVWFIDHRDYTMYFENDFIETANNVISGKVEDNTDKIIEEKEDHIEEVNENAVIVNVINDTVTFTYKKDDTFIEAMHYKKCKWNDEKKCWYKKLYYNTHTVQDLAAEITKYLINVYSFDIVYKDDVVKEKVENNTYIDEYTAQMRAYDNKQKEKVEKEAAYIESAKSRTVAITYADYKNSKWDIEKVLKDSYDARTKTIKVIVESDEYADKIRHYYDKSKNKYMPQEIKDFRDGLTNSFEIVPELINADELEIDVPWELKNDK